MGNYKIEYSDEEITQLGYYCSDCGEYHKEIPMAYSADAPFSYSQIPENELTKRCVLTEETCIIDQKDFYIKGNLLIPVQNAEEFSWNVWVQITESDFNRMTKLWNDNNRILENGYLGQLATELDLYPSTINLPVNVYTQKVGIRPKIEVLEVAHPLFLEQEEGINMDRVISFAKKILYAH